jgi:hypothetical protein
MTGNIFCNGRRGDPRIFMNWMFLERSRLLGESSNKTHFLQHSDTRICGPSGGKRSIALVEMKGTPEILKKTARVPILLASKRARKPLREIARGYPHRVLTR